MLRATLAVIAGYVGLAIALFIGFTLFYLAIGTERAYEPGTFAVSTLWIAGSLPIGLVAAMCGGAICRLIARRHRPVVALAVLALVLGAAEAVFWIASDHVAEPRPDDVAVFDAAGKSVQPDWVAFANPIIGVVGILIGGRACRRGAGPVNDATAG